MTDSEDEVVHFLPKEDDNPKANGTFIPTIENMVTIPLIDSSPSDSQEKAVSGLHVQSGQENDNGSLNNQLLLSDHEDNLMTPYSQQVIYQENESLLGGNHF
jgi:hypothetical protein